MSLDASPSATPHPATPRADRPSVEVTEDPIVGRVSILTFLPGQSLPTHRNPARVSIRVRQGAGRITLADDEHRPLVAGDFVQLEPNAPHAVSAGELGLVIEVSLVNACCAGC